MYFKGQSSAQAIWERNEDALICYQNVYFIMYYMSTNTSIFLILQSQELCLNVSSITTYPLKQGPPCQ